MRISFLIAFLVLIVSPYISTQESKDSSLAYPEYRIAFTFGISNDNLQKENIDGHTQVDDVDNDGVAQNSNQYQQFSEVTIPFQELTVTVMIRPLKDYRLLLLRASQMHNEYKYTYITDEVSTTSTVTGTLRTEITERYTIYPLSFGFGVATHNHVAQIQAELIYALGYMNEQFAVTTSNGSRTTSTSNYESETMGYRFSAQLNIHFLPTVSGHVEGGYRGLGFNGFSNILTGKKYGLNFEASGPFFMGGVAFSF